MMERRQIVRLWQQADAAVLVTLVRAEGSSYRRPGARVLLGAGGEYAGTISGGCLEAEVLRKATGLRVTGRWLSAIRRCSMTRRRCRSGLGAAGWSICCWNLVNTPECCALMAALKGALGWGASDD